MKQVQCQRWMHGQEKQIPSGPTAFVEERTRRGLKPGQLDPETADFAHRLRELTGRRSYLRNFWYAAGARPGHPAQCVRNCTARPDWCILNAMLSFNGFVLVTAPCLPKHSRSFAREGE